MLRTDSNTEPPSISDPGLHRPFLERAASRSDEGDNSAVLGAFLVLRLVDQYAPGTSSASYAAVEYQCSATSRFLDDIYPKTRETAMLREIAAVAEAALRADDRRLLFPPLLAFAYTLEEESRFDEALDVLDTAARLSDGRDGEFETEVHLNRGRVLRRAGRLNEAQQAYVAGSTMAERRDETHSALLGQIGCGIVQRQLGNLPESERLLWGVKLRASELGDRDAEARSCHDLAGTLYFGGRAAEAVPLAFRAYELYEGALDRARALGDTGAILKDLGHYAAAQDALELVLAEDLPVDARARTELEYLELAALVDDRITFERYRQLLAPKRGEIMKETRQDLELKLGVGLSLFGEHNQAETHLKQAVLLAEEYGMGERIFHAEKQLEEARKRRTATVSTEASPVADAADLQHIRETVERLECLTADRRV